MRLRFALVLCLGLMIAACRSTETPAASPTRPAPTATRPASSPTPRVAATLMPHPTDTSAPLPTDTNSPPTPTPPVNFTVALQEIASGFTRPTDVTNSDDDTGRLFVVEQPGRIKIVKDNQVLDQPFLDITDLVLSTGNEQGLLSVAFQPGYRHNGLFFVDYTRQPDGATVVARYNVSADDPDLADPNSALTILTIAQPQTNHNGGQLQFGPDGYLYIGMGDGGGQGDRHGPIGNAQNRQVLLGKLLRIDVTNTTESQPYVVPFSNPFGNEVWAFGLRNPWRFSFDRATDDLYIADVGQNNYEEVDYQPTQSAGGENYGWRIMEGLHCYDPVEGCDQTGLKLPVAEYSHDGGNCAITGGYVYRGPSFSWLSGIYFFGDYCSGTIWSLQRDSSGAWQMTRRLETNLNISSFGEDQGGDIYVVDLGGAIYRLTSAPNP